MQLKRRTVEKTNAFKEKISSEPAQVNEKKQKPCGNVETVTKKKFFWTVTIYILKGILLLIITPAFLNFAALVREEKELKPEGFFIDVKNGQRIFKRCSGAGQPTVLMDAPLGHTSDVWSLVEPSIARFTKVCVYDRAGLGYSDRAVMGVNETQKVGKAFTVERMVEDFHRAFEKEEKPFVLVGADLGATVIKFYAQIFPDTVTSLILINPLYDGLFVGEGNPWATYWFNTHLPSLQQQHVTAAFGVTRIGLQTSLFHSPYDIDQVPETVRNRQKYLKCKPGHVSSVVEESYFLNESLSQARMLQKLRPLPTDVEISIIWTERYTNKFTGEKHNVWLKSQEMFVNALQSKPKISKIRDYLPNALFTNSNVVVDVISGVVKEVRSKKSSKY